MENANEMSYRQQAVPDGVLGRVNATGRSVNRTAAAIGAIAGGVLASAVGVPDSLWIVAGVFGVAAAIAVFSPRAHRAGVTSRSIPLRIRYLSTARIDSNTRSNVGGRWEHATMAFFSDIEQHIAVLREALGEDTAADALPAKINDLDDAVVVDVIAAASQLIRAAEKVRITASGVVAARSTRDAGHDGLAQVRGHRSPVALIQDLTGATHADAVKHVRLGESLLRGGGHRRRSGSPTDAASVDAPLLG